MQSRSSKIVAITNDNLHTIRPRGVQVVARAFVDQIKSNREYEWVIIQQVKITGSEIMCLVTPIEIYQHKDISHKTTNTNDVFTLRNFIINILQLTNKLARTVVPEIIYDKYLTKVKSYIKSAIIANSKNIANTELSHGVESDIWLSPNEIAAIISFEAFENIWEWPWENYDTKLFGIVYDMIPLRINEGINGNIERFVKNTALMLNRATGVMCISKSTAYDLSRFFPRATSKITTIRLGSKTPVKVPDYYDTKRNECSILMVGDIDNRKNYQYVMQALIVLKGRRSEINCKIVVVGNDNNREWFRDLEIRARQKNINIKWTGYVTEKELQIEYYNASIFIYLSLWEGFGLPIIEAMQMNIPIITSTLASMPEVGGPSVFYANPYDPFEIADKIEQIIDMDHVKLDKMLEMAKIRASEFSWDIMSRDIINNLRMHL